MARTVSTVLAALVFATLWAGESGFDERANAVINQLMDQMDAVPSACPAGYAAYGEFSVLFCGMLDKESDRDPDELKRRIDASLASYANPSNDWTRQRKLHTRGFSIGAVFGVLTVNQRSGAVVFQYPKQFDSCLSAHPDPVGEESEHFQRPRIKKHFYPTYPDNARVARVNGVVALEATIRVDGTVGEVCVQKASPPGMGFEEEAKKALKKWRYEPATLDGLPVEVPYRTVMTFSFHE